MPVDEPQILTVERQQTAVMHLTIAREDCPTVFGPAVAELMTVLTDQGITPIGPLFSHHWK